MSYKANLSVEEMARKALDIQEVQNVMSKHEYYHALFQNDKELEKIWVKKTPFPSFGQNQGFYVGYKSIYHTYGELSKVMLQKSLERAATKNPTIEVKEENYGIGEMVMHTLTTPIIEVAGDGMTAKGMWYSPGQVTGGMGAMWMWEKYGVDFVKEDGEWRIWHMLICTDFATPAGRSWMDAAGDAPFGMEGDDDQGFMPFPKPDIEAVNYRVYTGTQVPQDIPVMPQPYYTFSETFSYGPTREQLAAFRQKHPDAL